MIDEILKKINWLGHDCFRIDGETIIYFDPFKIEPGPEADLILISHDHFDHCSPEDVKKIQGRNTIIITEKDSAKKLSGDVRIMRPGESISIDQVHIQAVPAYNIDKNFHPKKNGWLGFIVDIKGIKVYHSGDSDLIPEMKNIKADIAILPVSGTYTMTALEAVEATRAIKPQFAIPMHYGTIVGDAGDAETFSKNLEGEIKVKILPKTREIG